MRRLQFIKQAQALGFSLKEIKELLALRVDPRTSCADVRRRAEAKIGHIDEKLRALWAMKATLVKIVSDCSGRGPLTACPILDTLDRGVSEARPPSTSRKKGGERR